MSRKNYIIMDRLNFTKFHTIMLSIYYIVLTSEDRIIIKKLLIRDKKNTLAISYIYYI